MSDKVLDICLDLMLPDSDHGPTQRLKPRRLSTVSVNVVSQLLAPKS